MIVAPEQTFCYQHDPSRAEERRRNASRGGRMRGSGEMAELKKQLKDLAAGVLDGEVERSAAAVVNQIINSRARLLELEPRINVVEELEVRLEALEGVLKGRRTG